MQQMPAPQGNVVNSGSFVFYPSPQAAAVHAHATPRRQEAPEPPFVTVVEGAAPPAPAAASKPAPASAAAAEAVPTANVGEGQAAQSPSSHGKERQARKP